MKVTFIATVYNEESTISDLLQSLFSQSSLPDEVIIIDGGSSDRTVTRIKNKKIKVKNYNGKFKILVKKGNRATGRNEAVRNSSNEIIVCSDAGCTLDKNWVKNITEPFKNPKVDVVAGYYKGYAKTIFQKCLIPYVLVMPDKVDKNNFLPATRSIAFKKSVWQKIGGFPEEFSNNEDYVFAKKLKKINTNIVFEQRAIVCWTPIDNIKDALIMFYRFAKGDAESHIFRRKIILLFFRYIIGLLLIIFYAISKSYIILSALCLLLFIYVSWSIIKNYKYVRDFKAIFYLPLIQFTSDIAVIWGTIVGYL